MNSKEQYISVFMRRKGVSFAFSIRELLELSCLGSWRFQTA